MKISKAKADRAQKAKGPVVVSAKKEVNNQEQVKKPEIDQTELYKKILQPYVNDVRMLEKKLEEAADKIKELAIMVNSLKDKPTRVKVHRDERTNLIDYIDQIPVEVRKLDS